MSVISARRLCLLIGGLAGLLLAVLTWMGEPRGMAGLVVAWFVVLAPFASAVVVARRGAHSAFRSCTWCAAGLVVGTLLPFIPFAISYALFGG